MPAYDPERESPTQIAREDWKPLSEAPLSLEDLSVGGCGGFFDKSLKSFNIPLHQIVIQFSLALHNEIVQCTGVVRYELQSNPERSFVSYRSGIEFFGISNIQRSLLNREVLRIEREQIRKELENKNL